MLKLTYSNLEFQHFSVGRLPNFPFSGEGKVHRRQSIGVHGVRALLGRVVSTCLYVDTTRNFDHLVVKNAKFYVKMRKKLQLRSLPLDILVAHWGTSYPPAPLAALNGHESLGFSLRLCFSNDVCSAPNSWRTGTRGTDSWLDDTDKILIPICLYCL